MPFFTIDQVLALKEQYKERPYPNFSLDFIVGHKNKAESLPRGDSAWISRSAVNTEEAVAKQVQGSLNKLTPEKYKEISASLQSKQLLEPSAINVFVSVAFAKALAEPAYSEMYARLCHDMARFELSIMPLSPNEGMSPPSSPSADVPSTPTARKSEFRSAIVRQAQAQFEEAPMDVTGMSPEEAEEALSNRLKKKKANIRFVGQLFLKQVLSQRIMVTIMNKVLRGEAANPQTQTPAQSTPDVYYPPENDIEVLAVLLETVGKAMDQPKSDGRVYLNHLFDRLNILLEKVPKYPPRVHFKIMNLIDLRANNWVAKLETIASSFKPMTLQAADQEHNRKKAASGQHVVSAQASASTANKRAGSSGGGGGTNSRFQFPEAPPTPSRAAGNAAAESPSSNTAATPTSWGPRQASSPMSSAPAVPFKTKVSELMSEWQGEHDPFRQWTGRFKGYGMADDELRCAVIDEVTLAACTTTKLNAQSDAAEFLTQAVAIPCADLVIGLGKSLTKAITDGAAEDSPKYFDRLATLLVAAAPTLGKPEDAIFFPNASTAVFVALAGIAETDDLEDEDRDEMEGQLLRLWRALCNKCAGVVVEEDGGKKVLSGVLDARGTTPSAEALAAGMVEIMVSGKIVSGAAVKEWAAAAASGNGKSMVEQLKRKNLA